jgi:hypothetical protein
MVSMFTFTYNVYRYIWAFGRNDQSQCGLVGLLQVESSLPIALESAWFHILNL